MKNTHLTKTGLKYILIYFLIIFLPFLFFLEKAGMTAVTIKTLGFISLPISLLTWLFHLEIFNEFFWIHITINALINILILLWIGSFVERSKEN